MRDHYDFNQAERSPISKKLKQQVTININIDTLNYFKNMATETGIPYQVLINYYLTDCVNNNKKLEINWRKA